MTRQWGVTEKEELEVLGSAAPWLFQDVGRLLYVGANQMRPPHHVRTLVDIGWRLDLLEIFPGNVEHYRDSSLFEQIILGDVRTTELPAREYDVAFWWHGCEHIPRGDLRGAIRRLERAADAVVLGCPNGESPQGPEYGNEAEIHRWSVFPENLETYGYTVTAYVCGGHRRHLIGCKRCTS